MISVAMKESLYIEVIYLYFISGVFLLLNSDFHIPLPSVVPFTHS